MVTRVALARRAAHVLPFLSVHVSQEEAMMTRMEMNRTADAATDPTTEAHRLFHSMWTKARESPAYDKREWLRFAEVLRNFGLTL